MAEPAVDVSTLRPTSLAKDPTQTLTLRRAFAAEAFKRFRDLKGAIRRRIIMENALSLRRTERLALLAANASFAYTWDPEKVEEFMSWLTQQESQGVLEITRRRNHFGLPVDAPWSNTFVMSAYQSGLSQAQANLAATGRLPPTIGLPTLTTSPDFVFGAVASQPFHANRLATLYTRTFDYLETATSAMDTAIRRELVLGMAQGIGPNEIATRINAKVESIGIVRARRIARTEIVYAHNVGALAEHDQAAAILGTPVLSEWVTMKDERVRGSHRLRHGKLYTTQEVLPLLGAPNCRCGLIPRPQRPKPVRRRPRRRRRR